MVVASLLAVPRAGRVTKPALHPLAPQLEGASGEEYLHCASSTKVAKGLPPFHIALSRRFLGRLKANPKRLLRLTDAEALQDKLTHRPPVPVGQANARCARRFLHRRLQLLPLRLAKAGGTLRTARKSTGRRRQATSLWYENPYAGPVRHSSPGTGARWRAIGSRGTAA